MDILLANDDGINAKGIRALYEAARKAGHNVIAVGPMRQQSGASHSLTVFEPLRAAVITDGDFEGTGVYGTPTDCVKLALGSLCSKKPDLVITGINIGPNAGPDILYSGTVAAACEASLMNIPAMAVSHFDHTGKSSLKEAAEHAISLAERINWQALPPKRLINVNYPDCDPKDWKGTKLCRQSEAVWSNAYSEHKDPRGQAYWWFNGELVPSNLDADTDRHLLQKNYITITPLKFEYTDNESLDILGNMNLEN